MDNVNDAKILKDLTDKLLLIDEKVDLENNADKVSEEIIDKLYKIVKVIDARDRRKGKQDVESSKRDVNRNEKIRKIIDTICHIRGNREKRSPLYLKKVLKKITEQPDKHFTGTLVIDFEENEIMDVKMEELNTGEMELPDHVKILKQDIDYLFQYFDSPDNLSPELQDMLVGVPKEKLEYARNNNVEYITKKPFWKLDGTLGWEVEIP
ncbi:hypothetical protein ACFL4T_10710 [candidate division KSB1 bacterium]